MPSANPALVQRSLSVIGIGVGNPDYLTMQAINALNRSDLFFIPDKGEEKQDLAKMRDAMLARFLAGRNYRTCSYQMPLRRKSDDYKADVAAWHTGIARIFTDLLLNQLAPTERGAFLVWGDPALYDSTLRILETVQAQGHLQLDLEVIPGITAPQALAAAHKIPWNAIGEPVMLTTGRRLKADQDLPGTKLVMLDGQTAFKDLPPDAYIYWGAYLGTPDEILIAGRIADVASEIAARRAEARAATGWIMDTYLVRQEDV